MIRLKSKCSDDCSQCEPSVIASYTTNGDNPMWDLTPYQGDGVGKPNALWRLYELSGGVEYNRGRINENGKLEGLRANLNPTTPMTAIWSFNRAAPMSVATTFGASALNGPKVNLCLNSKKG